MPTVRPLVEILQSIREQPWDYSLYLSSQRPWDLGMPAAVLNQDDVEECEDENRFALENGLEYVLGVSTVQDIVDNLHAQKPDPTMEELLRAVVFYRDNDAFIRLTE
jgi:hypothetical protein